LPQEGVLSEKLKIWYHVPSLDIRVKGHLLTDLKGVWTEEVAAEDNAYSR